MDLTSKKVQKNIIRLALCVNKANINDLMLLMAMIYLKTEKNQIFYDDVINLKYQIRDNPHICALLGIKEDK